MLRGRFLVCAVGIGIATLSTASSAAAFSDATLTGVESAYLPSAGTYQTKPLADGVGDQDTRQNALLLTAHVRAILRGGPASLVRPERVVSIMRKLTSAPAFRDGDYTRHDPKTFVHTPGFYHSISNAANNGQLLTIDPSVSLALGEAVANRVALGLPDDVVKQATYVVERVAAHPSHQPGGIRNGQFNWIADMMWARMLVSGDRARWLADYGALLAAEAKFLPKLVGRDGAYSYYPLNPASPINRMGSAEYSFIAFAGATYLPTAIAWGLKVPAADLAPYRAWLHRLIWGEFGNAGYPNWDSGQGLNRIHTSPYWGWMVTTLARIASAPTGLWDPVDVSRARSLCGAARSLATRMAAASPGGLLPTQLFGVKSQFVKDRFPFTANVRLDLAFDECAAATKAAGGQLAPLSPAVSFDRQRPRYAVTSGVYSTSITPYALSTIAGALPNKLLDGAGHPIGGLGGPATGFDYRSAVEGKVPQIRLSGRGAMRVKLSGARPGSRRWGRPDRSLRATTPGARLRYTFASNSVAIRMRQQAPRAGSWRLPVPVGGKATWSRRGSSLLVRVVPAAGRSWTALVSGGASASLRRVKDPVDATVDRIVMVRTRRAADAGLSITVLRAP